MAPVAISTVYDSANCEVVDCSNPKDLQIKIKHEPYDPYEKKKHAQWFNFRLHGAKDMEIVVKIVNAGEASFPDAWGGYQACISYDDNFWSRAQETDWDKEKGVLSIKLKLKFDSVHIAYFAPYTWDRHQRIAAQVQTLEHVRMEVLGYTLDGHSLDLFKIGMDPNLEDPATKVIWVVGRQHPGESMAEYFIEGFVEHLTDAHDGLAVELISKATFFVVPNMNPDGAVRGHQRTNAIGRNLNREWLDTTMATSPEVFLVRQRLVETGCDAFIDCHGDEETPYNFVAGMEGIPKFDSELSRIQNIFTDALTRATPDFRNGNYYGTDPAKHADLTICTNWVAETFDCLAVTLEMPFKDTYDRPDKITGWSPSRSKAFGATLLDPINALLPNLGSERHKADSSVLQNKKRRTRE